MLLSLNMDSDIPPSILIRNEKDLNYYFHISEIRRRREFRICVCVFLYISILIAIAGTALFCFSFFLFVYPEVRFYLLSPSSKTH